MHIVMYAAAVLAVSALLILWICALFVVNEEANTLFRHRRPTAIERGLSKLCAKRRSNRFANRLFKKIEDLRNDFA